MQPTDLDRLLERYLDGTASEAERKVIEDHLRLLEESGQEPSPALLAHKRQEILARLQRKMDTPVVIPIYRRRLVRVAAAAVLLIGISTTAWMLSRNTSGDVPTPIAQTSLQEVGPGRNGAVLTLSSGEQLILDSSGNGALATEGKIQVIKQEGELLYSGAETEDLVNTVSTGRGRQWSVTLPDGTRAWLNAASSLQYSLNFSGATREVTTTGEVYFEVAKDASRPFLVSTDDMMVTVLGTHFNINAYPDEAGIRTTLLEGQVRVSRGDEQILLRPGQQARLTNASPIMITDKIDLQQVMAWKSGFFEFRDLDLPTIMRQISRWYDIDVRYEGTPGNETFGGRIGKDVNLARVLKGLEITGVKFRLENNILVVTP